MDAANKTVSVVIGVSARVAELAAAVASVLAQSYRNLEVIVVAERGGDAFAPSLAAINDQRLLIVQETAAGRAAARNAALRRAGGGYVAFLAPADLYPPDRLAHQVDCLESHPDLGMVYTPTPGRGPADGVGGPPCVVAAAGEVYTDVAFRVPADDVLSTAMVRRTALDEVGGFDERLDFFEEIDLGRRIACHCGVGVIDGPTSEVRQSIDSAVGRLDPVAVLGAFACYAHKVERDDAAIDPLIRGFGLQRLGEHTAAVIRAGNPDLPYGDLLARQARRCARPKVSIIIPVYNGADYLGEAIDSALAQTYDNFEVIVVNDGSNDGGATERAARAYGKRIRYVEKENGGVATALTRGIEEMTGDFFSWLSHDDLYLPDKLELQVQALAQQPDPGRCVLYSDYAVFTGDPREATPYILPRVAPSDFRYFITTANGLHGCTLLVPRRAFAEHGGFDPTLRTTQDYDLWFRMADTFDFVHLPVILVQARSHPGQGTLQLSELVIRECNTLLAGFVEKLSEPEVQQGETVSLAEGYFQLASNLNRRGFLSAGALAADLGFEHLKQWDAGTYQSFLDRRADAEALAGRLSTEVEQLTRECEELHAQVQDCHRELAQVYQSRSWRWTVPLRYLNGLRGRRGR